MASSEFVDEMQDARTLVRIYVETVTPFYLGGGKRMYIYVSNNLLSHNRNRLLPQTADTVCCLTQHTADIVCCVAQQTMSAVSNSKHFLLCDKADIVFCVKQQTLSAVVQTLSAEAHKSFLNIDASRIPPKLLH